MKKLFLAIAIFRFELIGPLLNKDWTPSERSAYVRSLSRTPVLWPNGEEGPVSRSSLFRWLKAFRKDPRIESLMPRGRRAKEEEGGSIPREVLDRALALLEEEPGRSMTMLVDWLNRGAPSNPRITRSSLHRALSREPRYRQVRRSRKGGKKWRRRFEASATHEIWQGDAKGPFLAVLPSGKKIKLCVLSILDDRSRYVLSSVVARSESLAAAVKAFRRAAARFGLPKKFYADRHSVYDSYAFRKGLAVLGVHRIRSKAGNASARGKIEAFHRFLDRWFVKELKHQVIRDEEHAESLLQAVIEVAYNDHRHRSLKTSPRKALDGKVSERKVPLELLREAFLEEKDRKPHPKTRELDVGVNLYRVPKEHWAPRVRIAIDPEDERAYLRLEGGSLVPLPLAIEPKKKSEKRQKGEEPVGSLTPLLDEYRGRTLPQARPGFGLPEIYDALGRAAGRAVPATLSEARQVADWLQRFGPFEPKSFAKALDRVVTRLGPGRPLAPILQALTALIRRKEKP